MHLKNRLWTLLAVVAGLAYVLASFSPLRLTNDTVRYFTLLEVQSGTWPMTFGPVNDFLPLGYVYFLQGLAWLHLLTPLAICLFQMLYLAGSLYFVKRLFGPTLPTLLFVCLVLLSWVTLKFTITPLSELQFLFFSTGSLFYYNQFITRRKLVHLVLLLVFCGITILTRTAGIALLAALVVSFLISTRHQWMGWIRQHFLLTAGAAATLIAAFVYVVMQPKFITYLSYFFGPLMRNPGRFVSRNIRRHLIDWAEVFINIPYLKTASLLPDSLRIGLYMTAGLFFLWLVGKKMLAKQVPVLLVIKVYMLFYTVLMFNWPFGEARFWLPLIPLIAAILLRHEGEAPKSRFMRLGQVYAGYFLLSGLLIAGYYINLTFDKQAMANKHDAGLWKQEYEYHFGIRPTVDSSTINRKALYLLEKYDR